MDGPICRVLRSMYSAVKSVVRCGADVSDVITQMVGLRQGCVLSPCLCSLYIADLPEFLAQFGAQGVQLHEKEVRVLLYADDGALVATSAGDLQLMLDALREYCAKWRLFVNVKKTKVIVFHSRFVPKRDRCARFMFNAIGLEQVESFKYLGVLFSLKGRHKFRECVDFRLEQARRVLGNVAASM